MQLLPVGSSPPTGFHLLCFSSGIRYLPLMQPVAQEWTYPVCWHWVGREWDGMGWGWGMNRAYKQDSSVIAAGEVRKGRRGGVKRACLFPAMQLSLYVIRYQVTSRAGRRNSCLQQQQPTSHCMSIPSAFCILYVPAFCLLYLHSAFRLTVW